MKAHRDTLLLTCVLLSVNACASGEGLYRSPTKPRTIRAVPVAPMPASTPRDAYALELERDRVDAARAWEQASRRALRAGLTITPSFRERVRFPAQEPYAVGYRFTLRRGQSLNVSIDPIIAGGLMFADIFEVVDGDLFRHVHAPRGTTSFEFMARADAQYVLRLQPALGNGGTYEVTVLAASSLLFPVAGVGTDAIRSYFGDPRDGGSRFHEGVDIFAPRGTPVYAVADGYISSVAPSAVGGNVIWQEDAAGRLTYYYAHLDRRFVRQGQHVAAGDRIGTVGNTGNARTVAPHLHFAIYQPGRVAIDPGPQLHGAMARTDGDDTEIAELLVNPAWLGRWARVSSDQVRLRRSPGDGAPVITELSADTPLFLLGGVADWHRVVLPDGTSGFISARHAALSSSDAR